jgi:hypothetical protein
MDDNTAGAIVAVSLLATICFIVWIAGRVK